VLDSATVTEVFPLSLGMPELALDPHPVIRPTAKMISMMKGREKEIVRTDQNGVINSSSSATDRAFTTA
jgi:hypothetical protein